MIDQNQHHNGKTVYILHANSEIKVWGLTGTERLQRALPKLGAGKIITDTANRPQGGEDIVFLRGDVAYDKPILQGLLSSGNVVVTDKDGNRVGASAQRNNAGPALEWLREKDAGTPAGFREETTDSVGGSYHAMLRKREAPYCIILKKEDLERTEQQIFMGAYKGVTDIVTKYVWPVPAMIVTRWCIKFGLSPNFVTWVGAALMMLALVLFWHGHYGAGLLAGWIMTFLDTVDGKLARVTFTSSSFGNILDHGIDLIHPPFWYMAWAFGLSAYGSPLSDDVITMILWGIFGGYIAGRLIEGYFMRRFGFHIHVWRSFDSFFRLILARRNPNMIILTLFWLIGRPDIGLILITFWTIATLLVHVAQSIQAEVAKAQGKTVTSWLDRPRDDTAPDSASA